MQTHKEHLIQNARVIVIKYPHIMSVKFNQIFQHTSDALTHFKMSKVHALTVQSNEQRVIFKQLYIVHIQDFPEAKSQQLSTLYY